MASGAGEEEGLGLVTGDTTTARINVTLSPARGRHGGGDVRRGKKRWLARAHTHAPRDRRRTASPRSNAPLSKMRPSARRGPAGAAPLATGTSSASSSTRFINSSKPMMRPSIRRLDCSYNHTAMRVRWQAGARASGAGQGGRVGTRQPTHPRARREREWREGTLQRRTVCKNRKMTVSGCVIAFETRGAPDISAVVEATRTRENSVGRRREREEAHATHDARLFNATEQRSDLATASPTTRARAQLCGAAVSLREERVR